MTKPKRPDNTRVHDRNALEVQHESSRQYKLRKRLERMKGEWWCCDCCGPRWKRLGPNKSWKRYRKVQYREDH